ncbi:MAG: non-canonical purine NTP pyrophosphatase, RdgB/HAM1 family [Candidatus Pacebacteria bacterium CG10_big_fil_rev_8_21_14_0_10_42_12]|nr:RdgB/HAM1 family non-canonical purine NTP pyrophosphatase [Candidatus Paceibacterota bacterium]PIR62888.1 MAG: non-canonical purine NTP pyrophosphatase, RdgB/HAM1 family [Candidatus Pacebacteria bacterium CG10_big_fil_rev_8_21_14_0_10_42_12]
MTVLIATKNRNKQREIVRILEKSKHRIIFPEAIEFVGDVEETGATFAENALLKAKAFAEKAKTITAADDSGLVVSALDGNPGVNSKRWVKGSDEDRCTAILDKLKNQKNRAASFVTTICLFDPETEEEKYFTGTLNGEISSQRKGSNGFGYDPIFIPTESDQTLAELTPEEKNKLSHRGQAFRKLNKYLESLTI